MPLPRKIEAVIFDMDGLLFDTEVLYRDTLLAVAEERGYQVPPSLYLKTIGLPLEGTRALFLQHYGPEFAFDSFWAQIVNQFQASIDSQLRLKEGVIELLDVLDEAALPYAIATSSRHEAVRHHLAAYGLTGRFRAVVARGDYVNGKPAPDPFLKAAECLKIDPRDCLALEDSHNGVRAASAAGMMTVMVPDLLTATAEMEALCVAISASLHEVRAMVQTELEALSIRI